MRRLSVTRPLDGAETIVAASPDQWLPSPCRRAGPRRWLTVLHVGPVTRTAVVTVGPRWDDGSRSGRSIEWHSDAEPGDVLPFELLLPHFHAELIAENGHLEVTGHYDPPGGLVGRVADLALSRIARRTVRRFLDDVLSRASSTTTSEAVPE